MLVNVLLRLVTRFMLCGILINIRRLAVRAFSLCYSYVLSVCLQNKLICRMLGHSPLTHDQELTLASGPLPFSCEQVSPCFAHTSLFQEPSLTILHFIRHWVLTHSFFFDFRLTAVFLSQDITFDLVDASQHRWDKDPFREYTHEYETDVVKRLLETSDIT